VKAVAVGAGGEDETVKVVGGADLRIPALLVDTHLADGLRQRAERLHERLPHPIALQPEIIISHLLLPARSPDETQPLTWLSDYLHAARKHFGPFGQAS
jgi:hypothetical protein